MRYWNDISLINALSYHFLWAIIISKNMNDLNNEYLKEDHFEDEEEDLNLEPQRCKFLLIEQTTIRISIRQKNS